MSTTKRPPTDLCPVSYTHLGHRYRLDYGKYGLFGRICVGILANIGKLIPMSVIRKLQHRVAVKDRKGKSGLRYYSNYQPDYLYVTLQKEWCENTVDLPFEDTVLMAPSGWHEVLTWISVSYTHLDVYKRQV